jgi:uncharacterized protein YndB with AHSA1/START domain
MSTTTETETTTQVYRVYIKAAADAIWTALTDPDWTNRYGYTGYARYDLRPGGAYTVEPGEGMKAQAAEFGFPLPDVIVDGEVIEADPPHRLVTTWRMLMDPTTAAEPFTTITYEITPYDGFCALTVVHDLAGAPATAIMVAGSLESGPDSGGGGHAWILSDLKSLLETGSVLAG